MQLAEGIEEFIRRADRVFPPNYLEFPLKKQRECYDALCRLFAQPRPAGVSVRDETLEANGRRIGLRVYRPEGPETQAGILYMHGGGWVLGDLDSHDPVTADMALKTGATVIAVDYALAPEHPFPAPVEDCYAALRHVAARAVDYGIDPARLAVAGDSAGGNMAAVLCLKAREEAGPALAAQLLIYPGLGLGWIKDRSGSRDSAPMLSSEEMNFYAQAYLGALTTEDPYAAPILAPDFKGFPPAYTLAVQYDPLVEDARVYTDRLRGDGVAAELVVAPGLVHGCLRARALCPAAAKAFDDLCAAGKILLQA